MDTEEIRTVHEVIDALGGTKVLCEMTKRKDAAISGWRKDKQFPAHTYLLIKGELAKIGKSAPDSLWRMKMADAS